MSIHIYRVGDQIKGDFNDGEILENKPIQLSRDPSKLKPYSSIFYWAHAWAETTSTIGLHPHQAFEIMSFVLKGEIEHFDTKNKTWIPLKAGDVQIIRAGSGISHAEKMHEGAHMFQIWLDPDISKSLVKPASYNDYHADSFPVVQENGFTVKTLYGDGAPIRMDTPGMEIRELYFTKGTHSISLQTGSVYSMYLVEGQVEVGTDTVHRDDFMVLQGEKEFTFTTEGSGTWFQIISPEKTAYKTYAEQVY